MVFIQDINALPSSVTFTDEGYLTATAKVARTGIQKYRGFELGKKDDEKEYAIYRPEQEVKDSIATIPNKPITIDHRGMVNIKNNSQLSRGFMSDAVYGEDGWVSVELCINHPEGIQAFNDGYRWHSLGYNAEIEWAAGQTPAGEAYDAIMKNIRVNHDALVRTPRAGELATFDSENINIDASKNVISINQESKGVPTRMSKKYAVNLLDGGSIELEGDHASEIHSLIATLTSQNKEINVKVADSESALVEAEAKIAALTAEKDALEGKVAALEAKPVVPEVVPPVEPGPVAFDKIAEQQLSGWTEPLRPPARNSIEDIAAFSEQQRQVKAQEALNARQAALEQDVKRQAALDNGAAERARQENAPTGYNDWVFFSA